MNRDELIRTKIQSFTDTIIKNQKQGKGHLGNVYYLFTEDKNGNITSEAFGNNVLTNNGFKLMFDNYYIFTEANTHMSFIVGKGTTPAQFTDTGMESAFSRNSADIYVAPPSVSIPWKYDVESDHLYRVFPIYGSYFDYEVFGDSEVNESDGGNKFYEFGLWTRGDYSSLISRSLVYNENGDPSYIQKNQYERLYIYCYYIASVALDWHRNLISKGYITTFNPDSFKSPATNNNSMTLYHRIVTYNAWRGNHAYYGAGGVGHVNSSGWYNTIFTLGYYSGSSSYSTGLRTNANNNGGVYHYALNCGNADNPDEDNLFHKDQTIDTTIKIESKNWHADRFVTTTVSGGTANSNASLRVGGLFIEYPLKLNTPDTLVGYDVYTDPLSLQFNYCFGYFYGNEDYQADHLWTSKYPYFDMVAILPVTDCDIQSIQYYNYKTDEYEDVEFENGKQDYLIEEAWDTCSEFYSEYNGGTTVYVWCNPRKGSGHPITKFKDIDNNMTIFATNSWWDVLTWKQIPNFNAIPTGDDYQDAQYYITTARSSYMTSNSAYRIVMFPVRDGYTKPQLKSSLYTPLTHLFKYTSENHIAGRGASSYTYFSIPTRLPALSDNDNGWILIDNTLTYPDSNNPDTDEPYIHTVNSFRWDASTSTFIKNDSYGSNDVYNGGLGKCRYLMEDNKIYMFNSWTYNRNVAAMGIYFITIKPSSDPTVEPTYEQHWMFPQTVPNPTNVQASLYENWSSRINMFLTVSKKRYIVYYNGDSNASYIYQKAGIIDIRDIDNPVELSNVSYATVIHNTKYCIIKYTTDNALELVIYDMEERKEYKRFTLDSETYSSINCVSGWNNYVYIKATDVLGFTAYVMYDYVTESFTTMGNNHIIDLQFNNYDTYQSPYATDDYMIWFGQSNFRPMIVHNDDPTNFKYLDPNNRILSNFKINNAQIRETQDGKHLLMAFVYSNTVENYTGVLDLGYAINHDKFANTPFYQYTSSRRGATYGNTELPVVPYKEIGTTDLNGPYQSFAGIYKNDIIFYQSYNSNIKQLIDSYNINIYRLSAYSFLGCKITLKTNTIQCYNNTRKFKFNQFMKWQWTNKTSRKKLVDLNFD